MAVTVIWTCSCGKKVATPANRLGRRYTCPFCNRAGTVPSDGVWRAPPPTPSPYRRSLTLLAASLVLLIGLQTLSILKRDGQVPLSFIAMSVLSTAALSAAFFLDRRPHALPRIRKKQPSTAI